MHVSAICTDTSMTDQCNTMATRNAMLHMLQQSLDTHETHQLFVSGHRSLLLVYRDISHGSSTATMWCLAHTLHCQDQPPGSAPFGARTWARTPVRPCNYACIWPDLDTCNLSALITVVVCLNWKLTNGWVQSQAGPAPHPGWR